ncbi:MAG TPA: Ig-like domain-containing protein [Pseudolysinimonas sp.]|nr:Ig-like domain-containing protein [Pseudolysinimonas sp.]
MTLVSAIARHRKTVASAAVIAVLAAIPVSFALLHQGFPETDVHLDARDVWVTNGHALLGGRLNRQIEELDGAVSGQANDLDVVQNGERVFLIESAEGRLARVDPAYTNLVEPATIPKGSTVVLGGTTLAILSPSGSLWAVNVVNGLTFDPESPPTAQLGSGAQAVVTSAGVVLATSLSHQQLVRVDAPGAPATTHPFSVPRDGQLAAAGDRAVLLDAATHRLLRDDGSTVSLPASVTGDAKLQQSGDDGDEVAIATDSGVVVVSGNGSTRTISADLARPVTSPSQISAPVVVDRCIHAAWAGAQRYVLACDGQNPRTVDIAQKTQGSALEFRVNRSVVALNDLTTGNVWLLDEQMRLVKNWQEVTPPQQDDTENGEQKASTKSFEDTLADRTDVNRPPLARDDSSGVRQGRTAILPLLANDTDPDGDVLTISQVTTIPESTGRIDLIDDGRALQFTPAAGATAASFRYSVDDGRGGVAQALVTVRVVPMDQNTAPIAQRSTAVRVELGGSISDNVLADWLDPDGDDLSLDAASASSADQVRFAPDGFITFANSSGQPGTKELSFTVSDGRATTTGTLEVKVVPAGSLGPIGTPDYAQAFPGETVAIAPLANDVSNNGQPLTLLGVDKLPPGANVTPDLEGARVTFSAPAVGSYYFQYSLAAGAVSSVGLVRVDVLPDPTRPGPPIAVKDTAFLRPGEPTTVKVLGNDVSPSGDVLAIQSVDTSHTGRAVSIEVLGNAVIRITSSAALTEQTAFSYTISDGRRTATAGVTVVPVPPIVNRQPPVALNDRVRVRAGDVVSADVLSNDFHPDQAGLILDPKLVDVSEQGDGLAFVGDGKVRYQAGSAPGEYSVIYRISDQFGESATARVTFVVVAPDAKTNQAPVPVPQTARVFAGSRLPIQVPLDGIDPDGDSVTIAGLATPPHLGVALNQTADGFVYTADAGSAGTDSFSYVVEDAYGKQAIGTILIGVIPRPTSAAPPNAVDDAIAMQPGKVATVGVLQNDSDPSGYPIALDSTRIEVDPGITATAERGKIVVQAPSREGTYAIHYGIDNGHGGADDAYLSVKVTKDAAPIYPTAVDHYVSIDSVIGTSTVAVPLDGLIADPGGRDSDLKITVEGPNASLATVDQAKRSITVTPGARRMAIAYRVTSSASGLSATAVISVPPAVGADYAPPPYLRRDLTLPQVVPMNGSKTWKLADIVTVPSKKPAVLITPLELTATHGTVAANGTNGITFTAENGYRGAASIAFDVTDGAHHALLTMTLVVGDPNFTDVAPQFVTQNVTVEADDDPKSVDLRAVTTDPNPALISQFRYGSLTGQTPEISADIAGATLHISSPFGTQPGAKASLHFTIQYRGFSVPGIVHVTVVSSSKPLPQAVADTAKGQRGITDTVNVLANDVNPFARKNQPLTVVDAHIENAAESSATMSYTQDGDVTIHPGASFIGVVSVVYTIEDATQDPHREVQGRLQYTVRDVPGKPLPPTFVEGDGQVTVQWEAPATNGEPISSYSISWSGGSPVTVPGTAASHVFTGLTNGSAYTFRITATNALGAGQISDTSAAATPFGAPAAVTGATISGTTDGSGNVVLSWTGANGNGRTISGYHLVLSDGTQKDVGNVVTTTMPGHVGTTYTYTIVATNSGGASSTAASSSNSGIPKPAPPTASASSTDNSVTVSWGAATSTEPVTYSVTVSDGFTRSSASGTHAFTGSYGIRYTITVTATSAGQTSSASASVTPVNPYSIHLCYGGAAPIGRYLGVGWSGNDGSSHRVTFSIGVSTVTFSSASGSGVSGAYNGRTTAGDLNTMIGWTDNGTAHTTRWGDAPPC